MRFKMNKKQRNKFSFLAYKSRFKKSEAAKITVAFLSEKYIVFSQ